MNELASLGLILLFALFVGHMAKYVRVPEVTGYIFAGVIVGPAVLGWITHENLTALQIFSEVSLGLILFSIGSLFDPLRIRSMGTRVLRVTLIESALAAALVTATMFAFGQNWQIALLLGAIAIETAAATTLMVIRECDASGPVSDTLSTIIGINNVLCLAAFLGVAAMIDVKTRFAMVGNPGAADIYAAVFPFFWQILGSLSLGFVVGMLLSSWVPKIVEHGEVLIMLGGCVLLCIGAAMMMELSPLISSLAFGATTANLASENRQALLGALSGTDPPFYVIFFVIAGAELDFTMLKAIGALGIAYVVARGVGKLAGAKFATKKGDFPPMVQKYLGWTLLSQAGLAVGLTLAVQRRFPEMAAQITTIVLAAIIVYELVGPIATRWALTRSGEVAETQANAAAAPVTESLS